MTLQWILHNLGKTSSFLKISVFPKNYSLNIFFLANIYEFVDKRNHKKRETLQTVTSVKIHPPVAP